MHEHGNPGAVLKAYIQFDLDSTTQLPCQELLVVVVQDLLAIANAFHGLECHSALSYSLYVIAYSFMMSVHISSLLAGHVLTMTKLQQSQS